MLLRKFLIHVFVFFFHIALFLRMLVASIALVVRLRPSHRPGARQDHRRWMSPGASEESGLQVCHHAEGIIDRISESTTPPAAAAQIFQ